MELRRKEKMFEKGIFIFLCLFLIFSITVKAEEKSEGKTKIVRVAFPVQEGMSYFNSDGTPDGYNYLYLEKIAEYTGWKMKYIPYDSGDTNENIMTALQDLEDGKVELLGPLLKTDEMEKKLAYPEQNYGTVYTTLCALESSNIREDNAASLKLLRVGLWEQAQTRNSEVISYLESENFNYELHYYKTSEEQYQALKNGEVDVISNVSLYPVSGTRIIEKFAPRPYYFASSKKNEALIEELNEAINTVNQVQPSLQDVLFDKFFRDARYTFSPTEEQKEFLATLDDLKVLCVDNDAPYAYQKDGKPAGMLVGILEDFAKETGVSMNYTFCADQDEVEEKIKEEKYDIVIGLPFTSKYCTEIGFVRSKSIMEANLAYLHSPDNNSHDTVAIKKGMRDVVDVSEFKKVIEYDDIIDCIKAVNDGEADYAIGDRSELEYYIYDTYSTLVTSMISGSTQTICLAVSRDSDLQLIRLLNDYIYSLSDVQKTTFLEEGNLHSHKMTLESYVRLHPIEALLVISVIVSLIVIGCSMVVHAKKMSKKNKELQTANQAKSDFLTRMSHDIRTPMNGIIGLLDISDKYANNPEQVKKYHQKIRIASKYLLSLLNDVLDMSKMDSGDIRFAEDSVCLQEIMRNCADILEINASDKRIELKLSGLERFNPPRVITSEVHLRQIVMNIISNAIKYNKTNGKVLIDAEVVSQTEDLVTCRFVVEDTGIGMSEEFQRCMFEPFTQEHGENRSEFKGTGLGLSIVKRLIDKMGGEIHVQSEKDEGTKFIWTLTFKIDHSYEEKIGKTEISEISLSGKKVLVAEDNELNAEILSFILEENGMEAVFKKNGKEVVETFENSEEAEYDCILMDVMMPVMDGYMASKEIRKMKREDAGKIPIIALTANAFAEDVEKSKAAGMDAHLTKPIDAEKLRKSMMELMAEKK